MIVFYLLAAVLVFFSWKSLTGGIAYLRFFRLKSRSDAAYAPFASVFVPCRGPEADLEANLAPLLTQDYPGYEVIFIVDAETDGAFPVIERLATDPRVKIVIAGPATDESQKVHNLRTAVKSASGNSQVFVFADSDIRPKSDWLTSLTAPLADESVGAATGYRWFFSERFSIAAELRSAWNASIASALGANRKTNFCWGGSTAVRRSTFDALDMETRWRGTLADDFAMTRAMNGAGLGIEFVPQALSASIGNCTFSELLEFTTRQMKITRVYAPHLWKLSFIGSGLFSIVILWAIALVVGSAGHDRTIAAGVLGLVAVFSIGKTWLRIIAVRGALPGHRWAGQFFVQTIFWFIPPFIFLYNSVMAAVSREIVWRGIRYELRSPTETRVFKD
jgi:cellulose synthase/poly-beta-1,6-N-acetylglucosamine synthase-like glycosyltransferase